jgi:hypothetical protein
MSVEQRPEPSGPGTVVLDIGGDIGAAMVAAPASLVGAEIEIRPAGRPWEGTHTAIRQRNLGDATTFAGVFPSLPAGDYELRIKGDPCIPAGLGPTVDLVVTGGAVTRLNWPIA